MKKWAFLLGVLVVLIPLVSEGHRISLFLEVKGVAVEGFAYFSTGTPARNSPVEVYGPHSQVVWKGETDNNGRFRFFVKGIKGPLKVVVNALDGHRVEGSINLDSPVSQRTSPPQGGISPLQVFSGLGWIMGIFGSLMFWLSNRDGQ